MPTVLRSADAGSRAAGPGDRGRARRSGRRGSPEFLVVDHEGRGQLFPPPSCLHRRRGDATEIRLKPVCGRAQPLRRSAFASRCSRRCRTAGHSAHGSMLKYADGGGALLDHVVAEDALLVAPMPSRRRSGLLVQRSVLNSTRLQPRRPKACSSINSLASVFTPVRCQAGATHVQPISTRRLNRSTLP